MADPWIVDVKGTHKQGEIAVLRQSNYHGLASYGWGDSNKIIVHAVHTLYDRNGLNKAVWEFAVKQAEKECRRLNDADKRA